MPIINIIQILPGAIYPIVPGTELDDVEAED